MDRVAVFVDAGYVFAQGAVLLSGKKRPRGELSLDHQAAVRAFASFAEDLTETDLLRVYWYDGTSTGPTAQHLTLAHLDDVKVRLGFVNSVGEQKGVDSLIVTDMIALARNGAVSDAVLVSGDEDLRVGVQQAQEFGVRVHLVGIKPSGGNQSQFLLREADTTHEWGEAEVSAFLGCKPAPTPTPVPVAAPTILLAPDGAVVSSDALDLIALKIAQALEAAALSAVVEAYDSTRQLPRDIDGKLLARGRASVGRSLDSSDKRRVRTAFIESCRKRLVENA
jgi:uncharacterized LabA/DUF88 family protein